MPNAIIIGASSGIGRQLAKLLSNKGYKLGIAARREEHLSSLQKELTTQTYISKMDLSKTEEAKAQLKELIREMKSVELIIITSGVGYINKELEWSKEKTTIEVNVLGTVALINEALEYFENLGRGQLAVISSISAVRGSGGSPAYNASKAFLSNYVEGLNCKYSKEDMPITITDIRAGLIDTDMAKGEGLFWVQPLGKATTQIYDHIHNKKQVAYVTKRWRLIAMILRCLPRKLLAKLS